MATTGKRARVTVDLGDPMLYRAIRFAAIERDRSVREIVVEALRQWLREQEELEDLAALRAAKDEPTVPWEQVKSVLP